MDDRYTIETPENIELAYDIAGIGSRFLAALLDTFFILIAEGIILFAGWWAGSQLALGTSVLQAGAALLSFVVLWGYYIAFEMAWNGQSPGKRAVGLRVVREGGRPITPVASVVRNLIRLVDFLPVLYGIGVVAMFADHRSRRLGDLAAGVFVVREREEVTLESLTARQAGAAPPPADVAALDVSALRDGEYALIEEFLGRRGELSKEARARLADQLVRGLQRRSALTVEPGQQNEQLLERVAAAYQLRRREAAPRESAPASE